MRSVLRRGVLLPGLVLLLACPAALAGDGKSPPSPPPVPAPVPAPVPSEVDPAPEIVVHVPTNEMDVLLETDRRGVVLRHGEYQRLLTEARANAARLGLRPPVDGSLVSARGTLDLTDPRTGRVRLDYEVSVLADGPSVVPFVVRGFALDRVEVEGEGRYEELDGGGRLRFHGAGPRRVHVEGFVSVYRKGEQRLVDVTFAPAAAMALDVTVPQAVAGHRRGGGRVPAPREPRRAGPDVRRSGPTRAAGCGSPGAPPQRNAQEGPPVFDVQTRSLHTIEDGLIRSRVVLHVDVLRTPVVRARPGPARRTMAIRAVERQGRDGLGPERGPRRVSAWSSPTSGAAGSRSPSTARRPTSRPRTSRCRASCCPRRCATADRSRSGSRAAWRPTTSASRADAAWRRSPGRASRRCSATHSPAATAASPWTSLPADLRLEASSTYYLNLTEPAKSLLAAVTYRVRQGTAFELQPRFPTGYGLRSLTVNGQRTGFAFDQRSDGTVEVRLERGVPEGREIALVATLEQAARRLGAREGQRRRALRPAVRRRGPRGGLPRHRRGRLVPRARRRRDRPRGRRRRGAHRRAASRPPGSSTGTGSTAPRRPCALEVERRASRLDATVVAWAVPTPRRLTVHNLVIHVVERAGVRRLLVDVPTWARDVVHIDAPDLVSTSRVEDAPGRAGGLRPLGGRPDPARARPAPRRRPLLGGPGRGRLARAAPIDPWPSRVPLEHVERSVIVARAPGLEVGARGRRPAPGPGRAAHRGARSTRSRCARSCGSCRPCRAPASSSGSTTARPCSTRSRPTSSFGRPSRARGSCAPARPSTWSTWVCSTCASSCRRAAS